MVYDVLKAFDLLKKEKGVDSSRVAVGGESMGGRYAVIAAAIDPNIKGALLLSTSGFGPMQPKTVQEKFIASINPDMYMDKISPRKLAMFHARNDSVIPYFQAEMTFSLAKNPKRFVEMPAPCDHGYCEPVYGAILEELAFLLD